jgi:ABC-type transport system involved in cytochrome bd biosynthesis fused ATPase/permease subunit
MNDDDLKNWNELTPEQQAKAKKAMSKSRLGMFLAVAKLIGGLFLVNFISQLLGHKIMEDVDDSTWEWFCFVSAFVNCAFMTVYFDRQMKANGLKLKEELQQITKKEVQ